MKALAIVSIIEPKPRVSTALFRFLKKTPELRAGVVYPSVEIALKNAPRDRPALLLIDLELPERSVLAALRWFKANLEQTKTVVLTAGHGLDCVFQSFKAGADGWFLREEPAAQLVEDIQTLLHGGSPLSVAAAQRLVLSFQSPDEAKASIRWISSREVEILEQLGRGLPDKEIASTLHIALSTVNDHLKSIYRKLRVHSRAEAVAKYLNR